MATPQQKVETYKKILHMFDLVENVIKTIERPEIKNSRQQLEVAEEFIRHMSQLTETILMTYMEYIKRGSSPTSEESKIMENTTRKMFIEISKFVSKAQQLKQVA